MSLQFLFTPLLIKVTEEYILPHAKNIRDCMSLFRVAILGVQRFSKRSFMVEVITLASDRRTIDAVYIDATACQLGKD